MVNSWRGFGNITAQGILSSVTMNLSNNYAIPSAGTIILVAVALGTTSQTVTSVTAGTGTFARLTSTTSASKTLEMWVGYNFGTSNPTSLTVNKSSTTNCDVAISILGLDFYGDATAAPSPTASTANTATSTAPDCGSLTPAVGDFLFAAVAFNASPATTVSTARTATGNAYTYNYGGTGTGNTRVEFAFCEAAAAAATKEVWTIPSGDWCSRQVMWTPAAPAAAVAALVAKGLDTAAADAASGF